MRMFAGIAALAVGVSALPALAVDVLVYESGSPTSFFTPFDSSTSSVVRFGDSGWLSGSGSAAPIVISKMVLRVAAFNPSIFDAIGGGTTDINFTLNDGDPSGLVFGSGATLYSTTITGVQLPALGSQTSDYFAIEIPIPNVALGGGYNNIGFSVGVENFAYDGSFGFQNSNNFNSIGFITFVASQFLDVPFGSAPANSWSTYDFGSEFGNFRFEAYAFVPEPGAMAPLAIAGLILGRRRRCA